MTEDDREDRLPGGLRTRALLHSYAHTAVLHAQTGDEGYKKTLGMFRQRLLQLGIRALGVRQADDAYIVDVETGGQSFSVRVPQRPAGN